MKVIASYDAKSQFSRILRETAEGEIFVITRNGIPMAELRPCASSGSCRRKRGMMREKFGPVPKDFNAPLEEFSDYQ